MFFTQSRYGVTVSSVTSPGHVTDVYVYRAPSIERYHSDDVIVCRLANVYHGDQRMREDAQPFTLLPSNGDNNNTVSLYVKPRDLAAAPVPRDHGMITLITTLLTGTGNKTPELGWMHHAFGPSS